MRLLEQREEGIWYPECAWGAQSVHSHREGAQSAKNLRTRAWTPINHVWYYFLQWDPVSFAITHFFPWVWNSPQAKSTVTSDGNSKIWLLRAGIQITPFPAKWLFLARGAFQWASCRLPEYGIYKTIHWRLPCAKIWQRSPFEPNIYRNSAPLTSRSHGKLRLTFGRLVWLWTDVSWLSADLSYASQAEVVEDQTC